jgi:hypothetical protein
MPGRDAASLIASASVRSFLARLTNGLQSRRARKQQAKDQQPPRKPTPDGQPEPRREASTPRHPVGATAARMEASLARPAQSIPELLAVTPLEHVVAVLRKVFTGAAHTVVLFRHGTVVLFREPAHDPVAAASAIVKRMTVMPGGFAGDFGTLSLKDGMGWLVTSHREDVLTYLSPDELESAEKSPLVVGFIGRSKRHLDATEAHVVHVETLPPAPGEV